MWLLELLKGKETRKQAEWWKLGGIGEQGTVKRIFKFSEDAIAFLYVLSLPFIFSDE